MLLRRLGRVAGLDVAGGAAWGWRRRSQPRPPWARVSVLLGLRFQGFAGKVFGTEFGPDSIIGETRQSVEEACSDIDYLLSIPDGIDELADVGDDVDAIAAAFCRQEHIEGDAEPDTVDVTDVVHLGDRLLNIIR